MKLLVKSLSLATLATCLAVTSCKRDSATPSTPITTADESAMDAMPVDDNANSTEQDALLADLDEAIGQSALAGGRIATICGGEVTRDNGHQITIQFDNQTRCGNHNRLRIGSITVQLFNGDSWADQNAVLLITFRNFTTKKGRGNSYGNAITLNGWGKIYNVSGGLLRDVITGSRGEVVHRLRFLNVEMQHKAFRFSSWNIAKTRIWRHSGNVHTLLADGDTTINGISHIAAWGTGRYGQAFSIEVSESILANSTCGFDEPVAGRLVYHGFARPVTVTLGVDTDGNRIANGCAYGYLYEYLGRNGNISHVREYGDDED